MRVLAVESFTVSLGIMLTMNMMFYYATHVYNKFIAKKFKVFS